MASRKACFVDRRLIYRLEDHVEVCKAFSTEYQHYVCLKTLTIRSDSDINSILQEALVQSSLDHPNVCKIYDCFICTDEGVREAIVVMELMDNDLLSLIQEKRAANSPWSEAELLEMFGVLIDAFAFIQFKVPHTQGIVHRDIKPNNILIGPGKALKICDFGTSKRIVQVQQLHTLRGTQIFMSPSCKEAAKKNETELYHDPFKSDVYSLGLTFLCLARLVPPFELIQPGERLQLATSMIIDKLRYSTIVKSLLRTMLTPIEADRPDFLSLQQSFRSEPYLRSLNAYFVQSGDTAELKKALSHLLTSKLKVKISLCVGCTSCESKQLELARKTNAYVFCDCGKHCYCDERCYLNNEQLDAKLVSKTNAPCFKASRLTCVFCAGLIPNEPGSVELFCDSKHKFCSPGCLGKFILSRSQGHYSSGEQVRCPRCQTPINEIILEAIFGGRAQYYSMIKRECMKCHSKKFKFLASCGHAYCKPCAQVLKATMKETANKEWPCELCDQIITEKEIKNALSVSRRIEKFIDYITS